MSDIIKVSADALDNEFGQLAARELEFMDKVTEEESGGQLVPVMKERRIAIVEAEQSPDRIVHISNKDVRIRVRALDVAISDDHIAMMLPEEISIEEPRFKAKFVLEFDGNTYNVIYIGGYFYFAELRVRMLCFVRVVK